LKTPVAAIRAATELLEGGGALSPDDARLLADIDGDRTRIETQLAALREAARARETRYVGESTLAEAAPKLAEDHPGLALNLTGDDQTVPIAAEGLTTSGR